MKKLIIVLVVAMMFPATGVMAEKVVFGTLSDIPPDVFEKDGKPAGCDVEIIRAVCQRMGVEPEIRLAPPKRLFKYLGEGSIDGTFLLRKTEKREAILYYHSEAVMIKKMTIFARKESNFKINTLDDLEGKTISVIGGYSYKPEFEKLEGVKKVPCSNEEQQVKTLDKARMDCAVAVELTFRFFSKKLGLKDKFEAVHAMNEVPVYAAFSKAIGPKGKDLAEKFNKALLELKAEGVIDKILDNYTK